MEPNKERFERLASGQPPSRNQSQGSDRNNWRSRGGEDKNAYRDDWRNPHYQAANRSNAYESYERHTSRGSLSTSAVRYVTENESNYRYQGRGSSSSNWRNPEAEDTENSEGGNWARRQTLSSANRSTGYQGYGNRRGDVRSTQTIDYALLEAKSTASAREAVIFCNQEPFKVLLNRESLDDDWIDLMLTTINNALGVDDSMRSYLEALKSTLILGTVAFLGKTCKQRFFRALPPTPLQIDPLLRALRNYLDIFHHLCALDPLVSISLIDHVNMVKQLIKAEVMEHDQLKPIYSLYSQAVEEIEREERDKEKQKRRMEEMRRTGRMETDEKPLGNFREISVYPTEEDLTAAVELRRNCTDQAFESVDDYLDIQFRLLREDFVSTIRQGVKEFRKNPTLRGPNRFRSGDLVIYENLKVLEPYFERTGLIYLAKLDTTSPMFRRTDWKSTDKLKYGSLLCLSQDNFDKVTLFAVITEREDNAMTEEGEFKIEFLPGSMAAFDQRTNKQLTFTAAEPAAYFEPYKHALRGMQSLSDTKLAFANYIVSVETDVASPAYTKTIETFYRFIKATNKVTDPVSIFRETGGKWPSAEELGFNESQYEAYKMALTKEFAVIQGPPGTGKTFIGLKIAETLLYNLYGVHSTDEETAKLVGGDAQKRARVLDKSERSLHCPRQRLGQMLVICYTNHALDQFLEGILSFCPIKDMIRVGSRSKNITLDKCNLKNRKEKFKGAVAKEYFNHREKVEYFKEKHCIHKINQEMEDSRQTVLEYERPGLFEDFPEFFEQMEYYAYGLKYDGVKGDAMHHWLDIVANNSEDEEGFQTVTSRNSKSRKQKRLKEKINDVNIMTEEEVEELRTRIVAGKLNIITGLSLDERWRLYRYLVEHHCSYIVPAMARRQRSYQKLLDIGNALKMQSEIDTLKNAKVIGMTTTGAARMQIVLQEVGPEIIVVEEAAEVLEAHIVTALSKHCQHLILIGDHKQLKPNPTVYELAIKYHLDLSLFERMVNNGLPVSSLNVQHRMRPEISKYIRGHVYQRLDDHESVLGRDPIEGMKSPVYFFNHNKLESSDEGTMSKANAFEAEMVAGLTRYLLQQKSYEPKDITIITMYTGQLLLIKRHMPQTEFPGVKITSVDNFQGEENKIVIISLVRSNLEGDLGFVKIENRVCVSLSRAQYGMYVFGNFDMFSKRSTLWRKIVEEAKDANELGTSLVLSCQTHDNAANIEIPEDFKKKAPQGGCHLQCNAALRCGHFCKMKCHNKDLQHVNYECKEPCTKRLVPCEHSCPAKCYEKCPPCRVMLDTTLPCGHQRQEVCHKLVQEDYVPLCLEPCPDPQPCGHNCRNRCSEPCTVTCKVLVEQMCAKCNKMKNMTCHEATKIISYLSSYSSEYSYQCDTPCDVKLPCGHMCPGTCSECSDKGYQICKEICGKRLICGHTCDKPCQDCTTHQGGCAPCKQSCLIRCSHGARCSRVCGDTCVFNITTAQGTTCQFGCKHARCERDCGDPCSIAPCNESCDKMIMCKLCNQPHLCVGFCGEPCPNLCQECDQHEVVRVLNEQVPEAAFDTAPGIRWVVLDDCQHLVPAEYMDGLVFGNRLEIFVTCPYKSCGAPLLNTHRYMSVLRPLTKGTHIIRYPVEKESKTKSENLESKMEQSEPTEVTSPAKTHNSEIKLSAKERRLMNPRGPPKRPDWMNIRDDDEDSDVAEQSMTERLKELLINNGDDTDQEETKPGRMSGQVRASDLRHRRDAYGRLGSRLFERQTSDDYSLD